MGVVRALPPPCPLGDREGARPSGPGAAEGVPGALVVRERDGSLASRPAQRSRKVEGPPREYLAGLQDARLPVADAYRTFHATRNEPQKPGEKRVLHHSSADCADRRGRCFAAILKMKKASETRPRVTANSIHDGK